jgi:hypothetical protein
MARSVIYYDGYKPALEVSKNLREDGGVLQIDVVEAEKSNEFALGENKFLVYALFYCAPDGMVYDIIGNRSPSLRTVKSSDAMINFYHKISPDEAAIDVPLLLESNLVYPRFHEKHVRPAPRRQ